MVDREPSPQVVQFMSLIQMTMPHYGSLDAAVKYLSGIHLGPSGAADLAEAHRLVKEQLDDIDPIVGGNAIGSKQRPRWYIGPRPGDWHWPALRTYLSGLHGWNAEAVGVLDESSTGVVSLLDNPGQDAFSCRGLVVGYVQSGKTANMTAVIAKAVDAGYNLVIVLAGMTDKLRQQTQRRFQSDLFSRYPEKWYLLTTDDEKGDFRQPAHRALTKYEGFTQLAILKKNAGPLKQLLATLSATPIAVKKWLRALVIDDECDQASINTASKELDMTVINARLRELLAILPAVSYVGYTATPFANVFINPYRLDGVGLDDLYPKDFITRLPRPEAYFGPARLFGEAPVDPAEETEEEEGLDMIRSVPDEDEALLQPTSPADKNRFQPGIPNSLQDAILWFLASCAVRHARGHGGQHMSMLVHTSARVVVHDRLATLIKGWIDAKKAELTKPDSAIAGRLHGLWAAERNRLPDSITTERSIGFDEMYQHLPTVLERIEVPVENSVSKDRIDYAGPARTYIVVGGSVLSRGLTLEGLMVSYFLRQPSQADTMLQMGRWFGYRHGYEDLPRIWMPDSVRVQFRALAGMEADVRSQIDVFIRESLSPLDFAVRIRTIPGMAITAARKMGAARPCAVSYWGQHVQTIRFDHRKVSVVASNWQAGADLVSAAQQQGISSGTDGRILFTRVPKAAVMRFLRTFEVSKAHRDLSWQMLAGFVEQQQPALDFWNIGVIQPARGPLSRDRLGLVGRVRMVNRARLQVPQDDAADLKGLMSLMDVLFDCPPTANGGTGRQSWDNLKEERKKLVGDVPLLLLYPIDGQSQPQRSSKPRRGPERAALDAVGDLLGLGIVFPGSRKEAGTHFAVDLTPPPMDEDDQPPETTPEEEAAYASPGAGEDADG